MNSEFDINLDFELTPELNDLLDLIGKEIKDGTIDEFIEKHLPEQEEIDLTANDSVETIGLDDSISEELEEIVLKPKTVSKSSLSLNSISGGPKRDFKINATTSEKKEDPEPLHSKATIEDLFGDLDDLDTEVKSKTTSEQTGFDIGSKTVKRAKKTTTAAAGVPSKIDAPQAEDVEFIEGIAVIEPKYRAGEVKMCVQGRKVIKISNLKNHIDKRSNDILGDWVTFGIILHKDTSKQSKNGKPFAVFRLGLLRGEQVCFYLFGSMFELYWKLPVGSVIGLLNASIMENKSGFKSTLISVVVKDPGQCLVLGMSRDLGYCKAVKANGDICRAIINKSDESYCVYHISMEYQKYSSRPGIQPADIGTSVFKASKATLFKKALDNIPASNRAAAAKVDAAKKRELTEKYLEQKGIRKVQELEILSKKTKTPVTVAMKNLAVAMSSGQSSSSSGKGSLQTQVGYNMNETKLTAKELLRGVKTTVVSNHKPMLAKGFKDGEVIDLSKAHARKRALEYLKGKPIEKVDPNQTKRKVSLEKVLQKVNDNIKREEEEDIATILPGGLPRKRSAVQANLINAVEAKRQKMQAIEAIMNRKSRHAGEVEQAENRIVDKYFDHMEKKEKTQERMANITEIKCKVVSCSTCKYTAQPPASQNCIDKNHPLKYGHAMKRFFKCVACFNKIHTYDEILPVKPCPKCGDNHFMKTSMYNIREPKNQDKLLIRGEERKWVNS